MNKLTRIALLVLFSPVIVLAIVVFALALLAFQIAAVIVAALEDEPIEWFFPVKNG